MTLLKSLSLTDPACMREIIRCRSLSAHSSHSVCRAHLEIGYLLRELAELSAEAGIIHKIIDGVESRLIINLDMIRLPMLLTCRLLP